MNYVDGFVIAVSNANKEAFIEHAREMDAIFMEQGALRVMECWGDDVPSGKVTDFNKAVQATAEETVVFSWVEWPDKPTRDAGMSKLTELMQSDDRFSAEKNPMPFDGKRMIFGGFVPVVSLGS